MDDIIFHLIKFGHVYQKVDHLPCSIDTMPNVMRLCRMGILYVILILLHFI